jgi:hypothetical protein
MELMLRRLSAGTKQVTSAVIYLIHKIKARIKLVCLAPCLRGCHVISSGLDGYEWSELCHQNFYYYIQMVQDSDQIWLLTTFAEELMYKVTDMIIMNYVSIEMIHTQDL